jgi:hypothetical protein
MFERIKQVKKLSKEACDINRLNRDENDRLIVNLSIKNDDGFLSPYSLKGEPQLASETAEFLQHSIKNTKHTDDISFHVHSSVIDANEEVEYRKAIKCYYAHEITETKTKMRRNAMSSALMILLGILVFALRIIFSSVFPNEIFLSVLDVVAWVFVWEATDLFFFKRTELRQELLQYLKIYTADIKFINE